jgi:sugar phosphate isomerase/epimerase
MTRLCFNAFNRSAYLGVDPDLPAQIDAAAAAGFPLFGPDVFSLDAWTAAGHDLEELQTRLRDRGIHCWEIAALDLGDHDRTLADARHLAELAEVLRPSWILTNVGAPVDEQLGATLAAVCDVLEPVGARPAIEYLPFTPGDRIAAARTLVDAVGTNRAGILLDSWHHFRGPDTDADLEALPLDYIAYLQFDDALPIEAEDPSHVDLVAETLNRRTFPGEGEFDLDRWCATIAAKGFGGVVSVEVLNEHWRTGDLREYARRAFESASRFWPGRAAS